MVDTGNIEEIEEDTCEIIGDGMDDVDVVHAVIGNTYGRTFLALRAWDRGLGLLERDERVVVALVDGLDVVDLEVGLVVVDLEIATV